MPNLTPKVKQIATLKLLVSRLRNQRDYWKRRALKPTNEAARKAKWRQRNPLKYSLELFRNKIRYHTTNPD